MKGLFRKIAKVIAIVVGSLVALILVGAVTNLGITAVERRGFPAPGTRVEVGDRRMHVLMEGNGTRNVVLLGGLGTASPVHAASVLRLDTRGRHRMPAGASRSSCPRLDARGRSAILILDLQGARNELTLPKNAEKHGTK